MMVIYENRLEALVRLHAKEEQWVELLESLDALAALVPAGDARDALRVRLAQAAGPDRNRVALFGIGHHAIMFANAFGLADFIALAVDDDLHKAGFFPPGFRVPVVNSQALMENDRITTCLLALAPDIQARVQAKLAPLAERGIEFKSIYAGIEDSIMKDLA